MRVLTSARVAALIAVFAAASGCGVPNQQDAHPLSRDEIPEGLHPSDTTAEVAPAQEVSIDVWFGRDDRLVVTAHQVVAPAAAQTALAEVLAGPTEAEQGRALRSAIPDPSAVVNVEVSAGTAIVELSESFGEIPAADQVLAVGQLVLTLTDLRGIGQVRFVVEGDEIAVPLPDGDTADGPVSRDDFLALAGPPS